MGHAPAPEFETWPGTIQERSGDSFKCLNAAQDAARACIVSDLAELIKQMIESGLLEIKDGKIIPKG
jgi:hypothetical protein